jgi:hypothetical protein
VDDHAEIAEKLSYTALGLHRQRHGGQPGEHGLSRDDFRLMATIPKRRLPSEDFADVEHAPLGLMLVGDETRMPLEATGGPTLVSAHTSSLSRYLSGLTQANRMTQVYVSENLQPDSFGDF